MALCTSWTECCYQKSKGLSIAEQPRVDERFGAVFLWIHSHHEVLNIRCDIKHVAFDKSAPLVTISHPYQSDIEVWIRS